MYGIYKLRLLHYDLFERNIADGLQMIQTNGSTLFKLEVVELRMLCVIVCTGLKTVNITEQKI